MSGPTLTALFRRWLLDGDVDAGRDFATNYLLEIKRIAPRIGDDLRTRVKPSDLGQEAFWRLMDQLPKLRERWKDYSCLTPLLRQMARRDMLDLLAKDRQPRRNVDTEVPMPDVPLPDNRDLGNAAHGIVDLEDFLAVVVQRIQATRGWSPQKKSRLIRLVELQSEGISGKAELADRLGVTSKRTITRYREDLARVVPELPAPERDRPYDTRAASRR